MIHHSALSLNELLVAAVLVAVALPLGAQTPPAAVGFSADPVCGGEMSARQLRAEIAVRAPSVAAVLGDAGPGGVNVRIVQQEGSCAVHVVSPIQGEHVLVVGSEELPTLHDAALRVLWLVGDPLSTPATSPDSGSEVTAATSEAVDDARWMGAMLSAQVEASALGSATSVASLAHPVVSGGSAGGGGSDVTLAQAGTTAVAEVGANAAAGARAGRGVHGYVAALGGASIAHSALPQSELRAGMTFGAWDVGADFGAATSELALGLGVRGGAAAGRHVRVDAGLSARHAWRNVDAHAAAQRAHDAATGQQLKGDDDELDDDADDDDDDNDDDAVAVGGVGIDSGDPRYMVFTWQTNTIQLVGTVGTSIELGAGFGLRAEINTTVPVVRTNTEGLEPLRFGAMLGLEWRR